MNIIISIVCFAVGSAILFLMSAFQSPSNKSKVVETIQKILFVFSIILISIAMNAIFFQIFIIILGVY